MITMLLGFFHPTNILAQSLQHIYTGPKLLALGEQAGLSALETSAATVKAVAKGYVDYLKWDNNPDMVRLKELGTTDATFRYDWTTYAGDADRRVRATITEHLTGLSALTGLESNAVRRPAALMFLNMLREIGYNKITKVKGEEFYLTKELVDQYMVSTKWHEKPQMFGRSGLVGTATSPLMNFMTTWLGMFGEYSVLAGKGLLKGSIAAQLPLASFMALNLMVSGMLGIVGIKEWDIIASALNKADWFLSANGGPMMTGTEWILSKTKDNTSVDFVSDVVTYTLVITNTGGGTLHDVR